MTLCCNFLTIPPFSFFDPLTQALCCCLLALIASIVSNQLCRLLKDIIDLWRYIVLHALFSGLGEVLYESSYTQSSHFLAHHYIHKHYEQLKLYFRNMSYRTYDTRPGQSSYMQLSQSRQYTQASSYGQYSSSQPQAHDSPSQFIWSRRPAVSSNSRVYHDDSSDSDSDSDSDDDRPPLRNYGYRQATHGSTHEQERAQNAQRYREQEARAESQRVLGPGYGSVHNVSTTPMSMLTRGLDPNSSAGRHYIDAQRAAHDRGTLHGPAVPYRTNNLPHTASGVDRRVQTLRRGGAAPQNYRYRYY